MLAPVMWMVARGARGEDDVSCVVDNVAGGMAVMFRCPV